MASPKNHLTVCAAEILLRRPDVNNELSLDCVLCAAEIYSTYIHESPHTDVATVQLYLSVQESSGDQKKLFKIIGREGADPRDPLDSQNPEDLHGRLVGDYLENLSAEQEERFLLQDKLLMRFARIIDVVTCQDCNTRCFTKAYGHYVEGTGSMLQVNSSLKGTTLLKNCSQDVKMISAEYLKELKYLKLRYFTPREIANLHHFPQTFEFPDGLSRKQEYRVLGNSLNVHVVSVLLRYMVTETDSLKA
ncbi:tRNA (cytosine(38)-C(5))-methyltransferase-like [Asterias amurensis]|uniref:tRNA (cytosine(38)-C(5))-methyltransferase-like n=1 Tax=Asterias amurensis TaxID=7602 RepID=UPI003AB1B904